MPHNLNQLLKLLSKSYHYEDIRKLLMAFVVDISDVRTELGDGDSIESRKSLAKYLQKQLDGLQRHHDTTDVQSTESSDDV